MQYTIHVKMVVEVCGIIEIGFTLQYFFINSSTYLTIIWIFQVHSGVLSGEFQNNILFMISYKLLKKMIDATRLLELKT